MKERVEAKLVEARKQIGIWQAQAVQAETQLHQWQGIEAVCEEFLAVEAEEKADDDEPSGADSAHANATD